MSNVAPPPTMEEISDEGRNVTIPWLLFFTNQYEGDTGTDWAPTFTNLTTVGTPTITGKYRFISRQLVFYSVRIVPATSTTATAGSTYIGTLPWTLTQDGILFAVSGNAGGAGGMANATTQRLYMPAWTAVTVPLTIVGLAEVYS